MPQTAAEKRKLQRVWDSRISRQAGDLVVTNATNIRAMVTRSADGMAFEMTSGEFHIVVPLGYRLEPFHFA